MMKVFIPIMLIAWLYGCTGKNKNDSDILGKEKMQAVMWDIIGANSFTEQFLKKDSLRNTMVENMKFQQEIFAVHKITKEAFYKSYNYYVSEPELMRTLLDSMIAKGERDRIKKYERLGKTPVK